MPNAVTLPSAHMRPSSRMERAAPLSAPLMLAARKRPPDSRKRSKSGREMAQILPHAPSTARSARTVARQLTPQMRVQPRGLFALNNK